MDDPSRFVVSYGLHASASASLVIALLLAGIAAILVLLYIFRVTRNTFFPAS